MSEITAPDTALQALESMKINHSLQDKSELIDKTSWSHEFRWNEIESLAKHMNSHRAPKGTLMCREGAQEGYMCLIVEGAVAVFKRDSDRENQVITYLGPGRTFGEMSIIDGEPRSASIVAAKDSLILVLTEENFSSLLEESPRLGAKLLAMIAKAMSQRLRQTSGVLVDYLGDET